MMTSQFSRPAGPGRENTALSGNCPLVQPIPPDKKIYRLTLASDQTIGVTGANAYGIYTSGSGEAEFVLQGKVTASHVALASIGGTKTIKVSSVLKGGYAAIEARTSAPSDSVTIITNGNSDVSGGTYGVVFFGTGAHTLQNSSVLSAGDGKGVAVLGSSAVERIINLGHIRGRVDLGDGDDVYLGSGGALIGGVDSTVMLGNGNDRAEGGTPAEFFNGGWGNDTINGGKGSDTAVFSTGAAITADLTIAVAQNTGEGLDLLIGIENRASGGGADTLAGGPGDDTYVIDSGSDVVIELAGQGRDTVVAGFSYTLRDQFEDIEAAQTTGGIALTSNAAANTLTGNDGANRIDGKKGPDVMRGKAGDDTYYVDHMSDQVQEERGAGRDKIYTSVSYSLSANAEIESLIATGKSAIKLSGSNTANAITGNAGSNVLSGFGGNDTLSGGTGSGRDQLYGGLGNDRLTGGKGRDAFLFDTALDKRQNVDTVTDFRPVDDSLYLENAIFRKLGKGSPSKPVKLKESAFHIGSKAHDSSDRIIYNKKTGALSYDADGSGKKAAIELATFTKNNALKNFKAGELLFI